jgi:hypothetical protein
VPSGVNDLQCLVERPDDARVKRTTIDHRSALPVHRTNLLLVLSC